MSKNNFLTIFLVIGIAFILNFFNIRICLFFNIFKLPCPGCGLTRAIKLILKGRIIESFNYNILAFPIIIAFGIYFVFFIIGKRKLLDDFLKRHIKALLIISIILVLISWIINIKNPLLY